MACALALFACLIGIVWRRPQILHVLWLLVLLKLMTPSLIEVPVVWEGAVVSATSNMIVDEERATEVPVSSEKVNEMALEESEPIEEPLLSETVPLPDLEPEPVKPFPWKAWLLGVWFLGSLIVFGRMLCGVRELRGLLGRSVAAPV